MQLNCKVIKKVATPPPPPHFYINTPFSRLSPLSSKIFGTPPKSRNFWKVLPLPLPSTLLVLEQNRYQCYNLSSFQKHGSSLLLNKPQGKQIHYLFKTFRHIITRCKSHSRQLLNNCSKNKQKNSYKNQEDSFGCTAQSGLVGRSLTYIVLD